MTGPARDLFGPHAGLVAGHAYEATGVYGCYVVNILPDASDERGQLLRPFGKVNMADAPTDIDDIVIHSRFNVLRGMHIQHSSAPMWKYVRVTRGTIIAAVLDTSRNRHGNLFKTITIDADWRDLIEQPQYGVLIPPWCAWGYWTSNKATEVTYRLWGKRSAEAERVIHYRSFGCETFDGIDWPVIISERDRLARPLAEVDTGW